MNTPIYIPMNVAVNTTALGMSVATDNVVISMASSTKIVASVYEEYHGPTEVIPSRVSQVLETSGKVVLENIVVDPIPPEYGLITWDGSVLTVS